MYVILHEYLLPMVWMFILLTCTAVPIVKKWQEHYWIDVTNACQLQTDKYLIYILTAINVNFSNVSIEMSAR